jgi:predicted ATPase
LFIHRASAVLLGREIPGLDVSAIARICRRLDGIPLAIELAAGRVDAFGVSELETLLDGDLKLLGQGRRTASERHQNLAANVEWSYVLLSESEQRLLRRLSAFPGDFDLKDAQSLAGYQGFGPEDVAGLLANLVAKSLIMARTDMTPASYRLLGTVRTHAMQKLQENFEADECCRRYAEHCMHMNRLRGPETGGNPSRPLVGKGVPGDVDHWRTSVPHASLTHSGVRHVNMSMLRCNGLGTVDLAQTRDRTEKHGGLPPQTAKKTKLA